MSDFGGVHRYNVTGLFHDIWGFPTENPEQVSKLLYHLVDKIENRAHLLARWKEYYLDDAEHIIISYGSTARSARHLVETRRSKGDRIGLLELQTLWPFPAQLVREKTAKARNIFVAEMNMVRLAAEKDAVLVEINPLAVTGAGDLVALDGKMDFDESALKRHPDIAALDDPEECDPLERKARELGVNYVRLSGYVGTMLPCIRAGAEPAFPAAVCPRCPALWFP